MKILCLYNNTIATELFEQIAAAGHETILSTEAPDVAFYESGAFDLTISYTFRHILRQEHLDALGGNTVNLHNSYLPYNRGTSPNLWSILEGTPRGVSLHYMDAQLDKGRIITQVLLPPVRGDETLRSTYEALDRAAKSLLLDALTWYPMWPSMCKLPEGQGTYHSLKDEKRYLDALVSYDMTVEEFLLRYRALRQ
ncbi:MAG: hypothetical protein IJP92_15125 [Lachnospiraceae bacterium]|nr:hypothetical protein [Lachnospiraceae bacterium]